MVAEGYLLLNAAMCACALPLGGRLAGLDAPRASRLGRSGALCAACALLSLYAPALSALALGSLPACVWLCYGRCGVRACLRCSVTTLCASLLLGGAADCLLSHGAPIWPAAAAGTALAGLLYLLARLLPTVYRDVKQVELQVDGNAVILPAMLDSGNLLRDPVTALPVLVAPLRALRPLFPDVSDIGDIYALPCGFRLLSVRTAAGGALMPLFRPDRCRLYVNGAPAEAEVLVAVAGREYGGVQALVPMAALSGMADGQPAP